MEKEIEIRNAIISGFDINIERGFILSCYLMLDYGGAGQGFGGRCLYLDKTATHHEIKSYAGHEIYRIMQIADVETCSQVKGKSIRVKILNGEILGIGHIIKNDWYIPKEDFNLKGD